MSVLGTMVLNPLGLCAQSVFDGTWRTNYEKSKFSPKPITFSVVDGTYDCSTCNPKIHAQADGQDHDFAGGYFDTINVRIIDPNSIQIVQKKNGKRIFEQILNVSDDSQTLIMKRTEYSPDG